MSARVDESAAFARLLQRVPDAASPVVADIAIEGEGWVQVDEAVAELARRTLKDPDDARVRAVFAAVDEIYADPQLDDGEALAVRFFEAVCKEGRQWFDQFICAASRVWFDRHC